MFIQIKNHKQEIGDKEIELLRATASNNDAEARTSNQALAQVLQNAWKAGVLEPDTLGTIFTRVDLPPGVDAKFPLDFYSPAKEGNYKAFVVPKQGSIPDRVIEGDEVRVPTYKIANAISWSLDYARDGRWDVIGRALEVYVNGFIRKMNDDGWHVILKAANENAAGVQNDAAASAGVFTKGLLLALRAGLKRQTGGRNAVLTDVYLSVEAFNDILNFSDSVVDQLTLRDLINTAEGSSLSFYGVRLHELHELGESQEYQTYLTSTLGAALAGGGDLEFCVGLDLMHRDAFVMPVREEMKMEEDPTLRRAMKGGVFGHMELGFAALDTRRSILGSL